MRILRPFMSSTESIAKPLVRKPRKPHTPHASPLIPLGSMSARTPFPTGPFSTSHADSRLFQMKGSSVIEKVGSIAAARPEPTMTMSSSPRRTWETISSSPPSWPLGKISMSISPFESSLAIAASLVDPCPAIASMVVTWPMRSLTLACAAASSAQPTTDTAATVTAVHFRFLSMSILSQVRLRCRFPGPHARTGEGRRRAARSPGTASPPKRADAATSGV